MRELILFRVRRRDISIFAVRFSMLFLAEAEMRKNILFDYNKTKKNVSNLNSNSNFHPCSLYKHFS